MRIHRALPLLMGLLVLATSLYPSVAYALGADGGAYHKGSFHLPYVTIPGTTVHQGSFGLIVAGAGTDIVEYSGWPKATAVGERIVRVGGPYYWGLLGISETGVLHSFRNGQDQRSVLLARRPDGGLWSEAEVGPVVTLGNAQYRPLLVKVGTELYKVGWDYTVSKWGPDQVSQLTSTSSLVLVVVQSENGHHVRGLDTEGRQLFSVPAANLPLELDAANRWAYFLTPDRQSVKAIDCTTGVLSEWVLELPAPAVSVDTSKDEQGQQLIMANLGNRVMEYAIDSKQPIGTLELFEPGVAVYSSSTRAFGIIRHINSQGIFEYKAGELTWAFEAPGLKPEAYIDLGATGFAVPDPDGNLRVFRYTYETIRKASLLPGHGFILSSYSSGDPVRLGLLAHSLPSGLGLAYEMYRYDANDEEITIGAGLLTEQTLFAEHKPPVGEVYLLLAPVPVSAEQLDANPGAALQPLEFTLGIDGVYLNERPLDLNIVAPMQGTELWGSAPSVGVKVMSQASSSVLFLGDMQYTETNSEGFAEGTSMLGGQFVDGTGVYAISERGHITFASLVVINHWLATKPADKVTMNGKVIIDVPDAQEIDLGSSVLQVAGVPCALTADDSGRKLIGTPSTALPAGLAKAQLALYSKPSDGEQEGVLLDALEWDISIIECRIARLWIGKPTGEIDGEQYGLEAAPYVLSGRTMVPIRFVGDAMKASLGWNNRAKQASFELAGQRVELTIGSRKAVVNGESVMLETAPTVVNGRTFVPLRFVSENLGAKVDWLSSSKQITLTIE